jgi:hypothetical protein
MQHGLVMCVSERPLSRCTLTTLLLAQASMATLACRLVLYDGRPVLWLPTTELLIPSFDFNPCSALGQSAHV